MTDFGGAIGNLFGGAIGNLFGVPIITDHRMRHNEAMLMPAGWSPDFTDRSFVKDGCNCCYCKWCPDVHVIEGPGA